MPDKEVSNENTVENDAKPGGSDTNRNSTDSGDHTQNKNGANNAENTKDKKVNIENKDAARDCKQDAGHDCKQNGNTSQQSSGNGIKTNNGSNQLVHLNVGGVDYITTLSTLTKYPSSMLGAMFSSDLEPTLKDDDGKYFIDRDGLMFKYVLNFLRSGQLSLPEEFTNFMQLKVEADYYQMTALVDAVEFAHSEYLNVKNKRKDHESGDFIEIRETHYGRSKDYREQMERVHMIFIGKWCYINEFRVFLQSSRLADGTEGLPGVQCMIYGDYCEMSWTSEEQYFRIKLGDYLSRMSWKLVDSSVTASACEYYNYRTNTKVDGAIQKIFRDKWFKPHTKQ